MRTGKTTERASVPFRAADHLRDDEAIAGFLESALESGDRVDVLAALRTVAEAAGGVAVLAKRTGLSRETLYRTLSASGNPRLETLCAIAAAFDLRVALVPRRKVRKRVAAQSHPLPRKTSPRGRQPAAGPRAGKR